MNPFCIVCFTDFISNRWREGEEGEGRGGGRGGRERGGGRGGWDELQVFLEPRPSKHPTHMHTVYINTPITAKDTIQAFCVLENCMYSIQFFPSVRPVFTYSIRQRWMTPAVMGLAIILRNLKL